MPNTLHIHTTEVGQLPQTGNGELETRGYRVAPFLPELEMQEIHRAYATHFGVQNPGAGFYSTMQSQDITHKHEVDTYLKSRLEPLLETLLPGYRILFANFLMKEPGSDSAVGIHRDWNYVDEAKFVSYNVWIPLVDIVPENGSFHVLPGSHVVPHPPRGTPFDEKAFEGLTYRIHTLSEALFPKAGEAIIYHSGLVHYSKANKSTHARLAIGMVCIPQEAEPVHFHRSTTGDRYTRYAITPDFYVRHPIGTTPTHAEAVSEHDYQPVSEEALARWLDQAMARNIPTPTDVAAYYDRTTQGYLDTYGTIIQAFRPQKEKDLHRYIIQQADIRKGMRVLDAGCGVAGPAMGIAQKLRVDIRGYTISDTQVHTAQRLLRGKRLRGRVEIRLGDYHRLTEQVETESVDRVLFLESLGHSNDVETAIQQAFSVLKPGGAVYIKDFFPFEIADSVKADRHRFVVDQINRAYSYNVLNLNSLLSALRRAGFEISYVKKFDFADDITARAAFEAKFGIDLFGDMKEFRVAEWLELYFTKPVTPLY